MAGKLRVHELAKQLGVTSKELLATLKDQGEFVKTASSTIEPPVVKKMRAFYEAQGGGSAEKAEKPADKPAGKPAAKPAASNAAKPGAPKPGAPKPAAPAAEKPAAPKPAQSAAPKPGAPKPAAPAQPAQPVSYTHLTLPTKA